MVLWPGRKLGSKNKMKNRKEIINIYSGRLNKTQPYHNKCCTKCIILIFFDKTLTHFGEVKNEMKTLDVFKTFAK